MYRSSSATICRGVRSASFASACSVRLLGMFGLSGFENRDVRVGIHANVAGDLKALLDDVLRLEGGVDEEGARRGESIGTAGADRENSVVGFDELAGARDQESVLPIGDDEHCL